MSGLKKQYLPEPGETIWLQTRDGGENTMVVDLINQAALASGRYPGGVVVLDHDGFWCRRKPGFLTRSRRLDRMLAARSPRQRDQDAPPLQVEAGFLLESLGFLARCGNLNPRIAELDPAGRRLAAWAQAVFARPGLIVAPEPFRDLDEPGKKVLAGFLSALCNDTGLGLVLVSPASALASSLAGRTMTADALKD